MLLSGFNHVATLTNDSERLHAFYREVFDAEVTRDGAEFPDDSGPRLSIIRIGPGAELNVFQIEGNTEARTAKTDVRAGADRSPGTSGAIAGEL